MLATLNGITPQINNILNTKINKYKDTENLWHVLLHTHLLKTLPNY